MDAHSNANSKTFVPSSPLLPDMKNIDFASLKDLKGMEKIMESLSNPDAASYDKLMEELQRNHSFDYKTVLDMLRNSKSTNPILLEQLEKVLTSHGEKITENTINDTFSLMKQYSNNVKSVKSQDEDIEGSMASDSDSDSMSIENAFEHKEGQNLIDSVKENIENMLNSSAFKRKATKKRWWTPEEVLYHSRCLFTYL